MTLEHLWGAWLAKEFGSTFETAGFAERRGFDDIFETWPERPLAGAARLVCRKCNNGWMSALELAAKDRLLPMIHGNPVRLRPQHQVAIASWAVLKALVQDRAHPGGSVVPQQDLADFHRQRQPLWSMSVWLGRTQARIQDPDDGREFIASRRSSDLTHNVTADWSAATHDTVRAGARIYAHTLQLGDLIIEVLNHAVAHRQTAVKPAAAACFRQIWPIRGRVEWPPAKPIDDLSIGWKQLSQYFGVIDKPRTTDAPASGRASSPMTTASQARTRSAAR